MTGAVVVIKEAPAYNIGDVITFNSVNTKIPTTHRIIGVEKVDGINYFVSKGDANEERDTNLVATGDIVGKVMVDVPYVGYLLDFARQPLGFALLIGIPALMIVLSELTNIWYEVRRIRQIKFTKEMIMPLVIAPYQPPVIGVQNFTPIKTRLMDIKPLQRPVVIKEEPRFVEKLPRTRVAHDIRPKFALATGAVALVVVMSGQIAVDNSTFSYPGDIETTTANTFLAQTLDFNVDPEVSDVLLDGGQSEVLVNIIPNSENAGNLVYDLTLGETSGNPAFCNDILVEAGLPLAFTGSLGSLTGDNIAFANPWSLKFSLAQSYLAGESCATEIIFKGYLENTDGTSGYVDTEIVTLNFATPAPTPVQNLAPSTNLLETDTSESLVNEEIIEDQPEPEITIPVETPTEPEPIATEEVKTETETPTELDPELIPKTPETILP